MDELTGQLNMGSYLNYFENTTLSSEQKSSAMSSFKSCMTANLIAPNLPIFIHWVESGKSNELTYEVFQNKILIVSVHPC